MSIKVWRAEKVPISKMNEEIERLEDIILDNTVDFLLSQFEDWSDDVFENEDYIDEPDRAKYKLVLDINKKGHQGTKKFLLDIKTFISVWILDGNAYLRPISSSGNGLLKGIPCAEISEEEEEELPDYVDWFAYWNNIDPPEWAEYSEDTLEYEGEWKEREDFWRDEYDKAKRLTYFVTDPTTTLGVRELSKRFHKEACEMETGMMPANLNNDVEYYLDRLNEIVFL